MGSIARSSRDYGSSIRRGMAVYKGKLTKAGGMRRKRVEWEKCDRGGGSWGS